MSQGERSAKEAPRRPTRSRRATRQAYCRGQARARATRLQRSVRLGHQAVAPRHLAVCSGGEALRRRHRGGGACAGRVAPCGEARRQQAVQERGKHMQRGGTRRGPARRRCAPPPSSPAQQAAGLRSVAAAARMADQGGKTVRRAVSMRWSAAADASRRTCAGADRAADRARVCRAAAAEAGALAVRWTALPHPLLRGLTRNRHSTRCTAPRPPFTAARRPACTR